MSHDIKVNLEDTARIAWEHFGSSWSFPGLGVDYPWLYNLQGWNRGKKPSPTAQAFLYQLWDLLSSSHGEASLEEDIAECVLQRLQRFGENWHEMFTKEFLAKELGVKNPNKISPGVKKTHAQIWRILEELQPMRPRPQGSNSSASSASAPSASSRPFAPSAGSALPL